MDEIRFVSVINIAENKIIMLTSEEEAITIYPLILKVTMWLLSLRYRFHIGGQAKVCSGHILFHLAMVTEGFSIKVHKLRLMHFPLGESIFLIFYSRSGFSVII